MLIFSSCRQRQPLFKSAPTIIVKGDDAKLWVNPFDGAATVTMSFVLDTTGDSGHWKYDWIVNGTVVTNRALSASFESAIGGVGIAKHGSYSPHAFKPFSLVRQ